MPFPHGISQNTKAKGRKKKTATEKITLEPAYHNYNMVFDKRKDISKGHHY